MARLPRIDFVGARHHVMNRGLRKTDIFVVPWARRRFLALLQHVPRRFGIRVCAYALMPNHYHLLVQSNRARLSSAMQWLQSRFVQWTNHRLDTDGPLFRGRFRNRVVLDDAYWRHLFAYVHTNPLRAGLAASPTWTSRRHWLGGPAPDWFDLDELLIAHGGHLEAHP